ncbi:Cytochrome P450 [Gossypium arboreum]|uniref:Cytochrome P450 n=1 Tax=Gossypium arboreum TaxID=29729 RepID=A0A0B0P8U4_GOSAR|nr:Cytochrome P450 [Gossypium arboreum]
MVINALSQVINAPRPFSSATDHASTSRPKFQHRVRAISTDRAESSSTRVHASNHVIFTPRKAKLFRSRPPCVAELVTARGAEHEGPMNGADRPRVGAQRTGKNFRERDATSFWNDRLMTKTVPFQGPESTR